MPSSGKTTLFQLMTSAREAGRTKGDVAIGISTSGGSRNVLAAFAQASARGLVTVGFTGYDGGEMAVSPDVEHCLVVRSDSIHRVQETQAALGFELWSAVQRRVEPVDGEGRR